jgi:uncharacterized protein YjbJ (UPF0337 family)
VLQRTRCSIRVARYAATPDSHFDQASMEDPMNSDISEGKWRELKGSVKEKWGKLTDDDLLEVEGQLDKFCGKMQKLYGMSRQDAEQEFNRFKD